MAARHPWWDLGNCPAVTLEKPLGERSHRATLIGSRSEDSKRLSKRFGAIVLKIGLPLTDPGVFDGAIFMVDIFTKYVAARPFKGKRTENLLEPFKQSMADMGGKPEMFYTDTEGAFNSKLFQSFFDTDGIIHQTTNTHAGVVERLIRAIKNYVYSKMKRSTKQWHELLQFAINYYNNTHEHDVIKMPPQEASKSRTT